MGYIEAVCISAKKGVVKKEVDQVVLKSDWGITNDAHAGDWHRQISLLAGESIDQVKKKMPALKHGVFAENMVTRDFDLLDLSVGDRVIINDEAVLEITQIGKVCHNKGCAIKRATGDCIMPREGLFAKVIQGGLVKPGNVINRRQRADDRRQE